jgi:hypothetical protein
LVINLISINHSNILSFIRDDVEWSEEQNEQANAIIEKQYEQRMSDTKWGLLRR